MSMWRLEFVDELITGGVPKGVAIGMLHEMEKDIDYEADPRSEAIEELSRWQD